MYSFQNDYSEGCHPRILEALVRSNLEQTAGYGRDPHCQAAARLIQEAAACPEAQVHFLSGGTQTNLLAVSAFLRPWEAVIAAETGHIAGHEAAAVEATGHKVVPVPAPAGRLTPESIEQAVQAHQEEYTPRPALVYLSQATELGTVYSRAELEAVSQVCRRLGLALFLDGARLAQAMAASDLALSDLPRLCDAFYLGGTKNGALLGEALVVVAPSLHPHFRRAMKQRGAILAKGRLLGIQFEELFRDGLYWELGRRAVEMGQRLQEGLLKLGLSMSHLSPTNQIFPVVPRPLLPEVDRLCRYEVWEARENASVLRLCTSWATPAEAVDRFLAELARSMAARR